MFNRFITCAILCVAAMAQLAAKADGKLYATGNNQSGQLGDGTTSSRTVFGPTVDIPGLVSVAAGNGYCLALKTDGTVWAWGEWGYGRLGTGDAAGHMTPKPVVGLTNIVAIAAGIDCHSMALRSDGTVWSWGENGSGQVGDGTTEHRYVPVQVPGLTNVASIACGNWHSLAVLRDGSVRAWGYNDYGQLGDGTSVSRRLSPVRCVSLTNIVKVDGGFGFSLALDADGFVWSFGFNGVGQLGDGSRSGLVPGRIPGLTNIVDIACGHEFGVALAADGKVWAWGNNRHGELGNGTGNLSYTPRLVAGIADAVAVFTGDNHSFALLSDQTIIGWGWNEYGQLGTGDSIDRDPVPIAGMDGVSQIAAGLLHTLAIQSPVTPVDTAMYVPDRQATITETVRLKAYLYRMVDRDWCRGASVCFAVDGTSVGATRTDVYGQAALDWAISDGPATRTITASSAGTPFVGPSSGTGKLTARTIDTELYVPSQSCAIGDTALLRAYLYYGSAHMPSAGHTVRFAVDGVDVGEAATNAFGRALLAYAVPEGAGPGRRALAGRWDGNGGYRTSSAASSLYVERAPTNLWLASRSAQRTLNTYLRAYLRRLPDYVWLSNKTVRFELDGTVLGAAVTNSSGCASYLYHVTQAAGSYPMVASFDGDGSYLPAGSEGALTVVP